MQTSLVGGELLGHLSWSLDHPEVEVLGLNHQVVAVRNLLLNLGNLLAGESRYDTVHECSVNAASLLEPLLEVLAQLPQVDILIDAILQHVAVQENQLAGEDDQSLGLVAVECLIAAIQQLYQLTGIAAGGSILQLTAGIEGDTGLSGVRDHETNLGLIGQSHEGSVLSIGVQRAADHVDTLEGVHGLAVLTTLQVHMVQAVLSVQPVHHTLLNGLYYYHTAVEVGLLVHIPDNPIYECTEEVTFTELNHLFRHHALRSKLFV